MVFFVFLSCPDKRCGHKCTLVTALLVLASGCSLTLNCIEKTMNLLLACRAGLRTTAAVEGSNKLGAVDALHRFVIGLRSRCARLMLSQFEACPPNNPRWLWVEELIRWMKSGSTNTACLENYSPGWLTSILFLFLSTGWVGRCHRGLQVYFSDFCSSPILSGSASPSLLSGPAGLFVFISASPHRLPPLVYFIRSPPCYAICVIGGLSIAYPPC